MTGRHSLPWLLLLGGILITACLQSDGESGEESVAPTVEETSAGERSITLREPTPADASATSGRRSATTSPDEPDAIATDLATRGRDAQRKEILARVDSLIAEAHAAGAETPDGVHVYTCGGPRVSYFVPEFDENGQKRSRSGWDVPDDAVSIEWSDRFVIAQERTFAYSAPRILSLERRGPHRRWVVEADVLLTVTHRDVRVDEGPPRPDEPEGYVRFSHGGQRNLRAAYSSAQGEPGRLPIPHDPPGEGTPFVYAEDPLSRQAVAELELVPHRDSTETICLRLTFDPVTEDWELTNRPYVNCYTPVHH